MAEGKYERAIEVRREADKNKRLAQIAQEERDKAIRDAEEWKARLKEAVDKADFAYAVLRAILPELRRGKPVSKPSLQNAWHQLEHVPDRMKAILMPHDGPLDVELRKDDPQS